MKSDVITLVLGGGRGTRLYPLTQVRSKPAVPVAGKYRLIDIPLSNCINSGLNRIYVLTQFNSVSLHRHIRSTYTFDPFDNGFVEILAAQQTAGDNTWYQGTADAVRKNLRVLQQPGIEHVLILSGDQLYRMDFREMIQSHKNANAQVTIAAVPVASKDASGLGIMRLDDSGRVRGFLEKPQTEQEISHVRTDPAWIDAHGIKSHGRDCLASMGIYLFDRDVLVDLLEKTAYEDFGREIFPTSIRTHHVQVHLFDGYWEDIGTIRSFFEANLDLADRRPPFDLISPEAPLFSRARFLPPSRVDGATISGSLVADGCIIEKGAVIEHCVIGLRCRIGKDVVIRNSVIMGADFYQTSDEFDHDSNNGTPPLGIGDGSYVEQAIIDKNCRIGHHVRIVNDQNVQDSEEHPWGMIRDGVIVVSKGAVLPDNWSM